MPEEWCELRRALEPPQRPASRRQVEDQTVPDANEEYLLYQTLVGAWPLEPYSAEEYAEFVKRIQAYMLKALHEAKVHSSWINPNAEYDEAIQEFVRLHPRRGRSTARSSTTSGRSSGGSATTASSTRCRRRC